MMTPSECKLYFGAACTLMVIAIMPFPGGGWGGAVPANHAAAFAMENMGGSTNKTATVAEIPSSWFGTSGGGGRTSGCQAYMARVQSLEAQLAFKGCEADDFEVAAYQRATDYDAEERSSLVEERDNMAVMLEKKTATIEAMGKDIATRTNQRIVELEAEVERANAEVQHANDDKHDLESQLIRMRAEYDAKIASLEQSNEAQGLAYTRRTTDTCQIFKSLFVGGALACWLAFLMQAICVVCRVTDAGIRRMIVRRGLREVIGSVAATPVLLWVYFFAFVTVFGQKSIVDNAFLAVVATVGVNFRYQLLAAAVYREATQHFCPAMGVTRQRGLTVTPVLLWVYYFVFVAASKTKFIVVSVLMAAVAKVGVDASRRPFTGQLHDWVTQGLRFAKVIVRGRVVRPAWA